MVILKTRNALPYLPNIIMFFLSIKADYISLSTEHKYTYFNPVFDDYQAKEKTLREDTVKKALLLFILVLSSILLFAQNVDWLWAKQAGGTSSDVSYNIAVDANGYSYVTGCFRGSATFGTTTLTSSGEADIFVAKLNSNGNWLWAKQVGGTNKDSGSGIAVDANGNSYVTGEFSASATFGTTTLTSSGGSDIFVANAGIATGNGSGKASWGTRMIGVMDWLLMPWNSFVTGYFRSSATFGTTTLIFSGGG